MSTQQLNPYHDNTPIVTFQCAIHAMIFQHGMFKKIQPDEQDKTVATQSKAACKFIKGQFKPQCYVINTCGNIKVGL